MQAPFSRVEGGLAFIYTRENEEILQLNYLIWTPPGRQNVDWSSVRFLPLSCSMLLSFDVAPLWRFRNYINERKSKIEPHHFGPKYHNTIINSESMPLFSKVECGDNHWALYELPVVTGGAEPQEGGGITRAVIEDPKIYPGTPVPQWCRWVPEETAVATAAVLLNCMVFVDNTCRALLPDFLGNSDTVTGFGNLSAKKTPQKMYEVFIHIHENAKYCDYSILILIPPGRHNVDWPSARFLPISCSTLLRFHVAALWRCSEFLSTKVKFR